MTYYSDGIVPSSKSRIAFCPDVLRWSGSMSDHVNLDDPLSTTLSSAEADEYTCEQERVYYAGVLPLIRCCKFATPSGENVYKIWRKWLRIDKSDIKKSSTDLVHYIKKLPKVLSHAGAWLLFTEGILHVLYYPCTENSVADQSLHWFEQLQHHWRLGRVHGGNKWDRWACIAWWKRKENESSGEAVLVSGQVSLTVPGGLLIPLISKTAITISNPIWTRTILALNGAKSICHVRGLNLL